MIISSRIDGMCVAGYKRCSCLIHHLIGVTVGRYETDGPEEVERCSKASRFGGKHTLMPWVLFLR